MSSTQGILVLLYYSECLQGSESQTMQHQAVCALRAYSQVGMCYTRGPYLKLCKGVGVVRQAQGVESTARVQRVSHFSGGAAIDAVALGQAQKDHLQVVRAFITWSCRVVLRATQ